MSLYLSASFKNNAIRFVYVVLNKVEGHIDAMKKESIIKRVFHFYVEGFREMKLGKTLWLIILLKLFIIFFILRLFFFPNYLGQFDTDSEKEEHVSGELVDRASNP